MDKKLISFSIVFLIISTTLFAGIHPRIKEIKYKTFFGECPSRVAGTLTLSLVKEFEKSRSLSAIKKKIIDEELMEKHFLSTYDVKFNPQKDLLTFSYDCPRPLMKVHIYKENGEESYTAILVDNGKLFDPTYEVLLRHENKLVQDLPSLALPVGDMDSELKQQLAQNFGKMDNSFRKKLSEIIISDQKELTIILSLNGKPTSVFLGDREWEDKLVKLNKIVDYMVGKNKIPTIINLTNSKKVVVKFSDRL